VGRVVTGELERAGHAVTPAGRTVGARGLAVDLTSDSGLRSLEAVMTDHDVLVNCSGIENPAVAEAGPLVEVSATSAYLEALAERVPAGMGAVTGAGLTPGLSTLLIAALDTSPGDEVDLGLMLGAGEEHGAAAVAWTAGLLGRPVHSPPEGGTVQNLREHRRLREPDGRHRRYLRADFPDHVLIGRDLGLVVRSYLTLTSRIATAALGIAAHVPSAAGLVTRTPHVGSDAWHLVALNRRTGQARTAAGAGQSAATGVLTALAAERLVEAHPTGPLSMVDLVSLPEALDRLTARPGATGSPSPTARPG
jgi:hypothetical protein